MPLTRRDFLRAATIVAPGVAAAPELRIKPFAGGGWLQEERPDWFRFFPDEPAWSFVVLRLIKQIPKGGAEFNEIYRAVRVIQAGRIRTWTDAWRELANSLEIAAEKDANDDRCVTAKERFRRAANYYFVAQAVLGDSDQRLKTSLLQKQRACFNRCADLVGDALQHVRVGYSGGELQGYFYRVPNDDCESVVIKLSSNVAWIFGEALWAADYGLSTLTCNERQSDGLELPRMFREPTVEGPISALIDYVTGALGLGDARIALMGLSDLSAHYCLRAAAFDSRVRAVACINGWYDLAAADPTAVARALGTMRPGSSADEFNERLRAYTLEGLLGKVRCPVLICYTVGDPAVDVEAISRITAELGGRTDVKGWTWDTDRVAAHNGVDNPGETVSFILDWLVSKVGCAGAVRCAPAGR